MGQKYLAHP